MERLRNLFRPDYLTSHRVENPQVAALIKIVERPQKEPLGGDGKYLRKLRNLFQPDFIYSQVGERRFAELAKQLYTIEQLGQTQSREALDYLQFINLETVGTVPAYQSYPPPESTSIWTDSWLKEKHLYPNARGALKRCLNFDILSMTSSGVDYRDTQLEGERRRRYPLYTIIGNAINTLQQTLK